jgi:predicted GIY-YIG superfamily endonuclease
VKPVQGTIYLLHFDRPYRHARHYLGWAKDLQARLAEHERGTGARLLQVVKDAGISWHLARTWDGDRYRERQLKKQGGRSRMCPTCKQPGPRRQLWTRSWTARHLKESSARTCPLT